MILEVAQSDPFSLAQLVGYLATIVSVGAFCLSRDSAFKTTVATGLVLWAVHYALLSGWTAAGTALLIASRQALSIVVPKLSLRKRMVLGLFYVTAFSIILFTTWAGIVSVWPWLAAVNATYAFFWLHGIRLRTQLLASTGAWLVNAMLLGSIGHFVTNIATITVSLVTIHRMRTKQAMQVDKARHRDKFIGAILRHRAPRKAADPHFRSVRRASYSALPSTVHSRQETENS